MKKFWPIVKLLNPNTIQTVKLELPQTPTNLAPIIGTNHLFFHDNLFSGHSNLLLCIETGWLVPERYIAYVRLNTAQTDWALGPSCLEKVEDSMVVIHRHFSSSVNVEFVRQAGAGE